MNQWDKDNLRFLMSVDTPTFEDWFDQADQDDIDYALELLAQAKAEVSLKAAEIFDDVEDFTEANDVLKKVMIK
jgi:hypothetical protein